MSNQKKKILLSGIQPTGRPHIGNYFGAMKQFVDLQHDYTCYFMIADYHALNSIQDPKILKDNIINVVIDYLSIGIDPNNSVIFKQSDVPEHTELAWIFDSLTTMPYLMRAHAFKDAEAKNKEISVGKFNYPMLMAADILLYDADLVPVGQDQKQHIEITRDTALKFNRIYGDTFKEPEPLIVQGVSTIPGIDGQKMSKSYNNTIPLFSKSDEIRKLVMNIVTDSSGDIPKNVYEIHRLFRNESELQALYSSKKGKYKELKEELINDIEKFMSPLRERRLKLEEDLSSVSKILKEGAHKARETAKIKMGIVKERIGVKI